MADIYEYWIGRDVPYDDIWNAYEDGIGYINKYHSMKVHLIQIEFEQQPKILPLFNFEAVYKTLKGYFHDLKFLCLNEQSYNAAGPLFIYSVERESGVWKFLGELRQLIFFGTTLSDEKLIGQRIDNIEKKIKLLHNTFGDSVNPKDFQNFMKAKTPRKIEKAFQHLIDQKIESIKISQRPFEGDIEETESTLVDIKGLLNDPDSDE